MEEFWPTALIGISGFSEPFGLNLCFHLLNVPCYGQPSLGMFRHAYWQRLIVCGFATNQSRQFQQIRRIVVVDLARKSSSALSIYGLQFLSLQKLSYSISA